MEPEVTKPADGMTDYGLIELSGSENTRDQGGNGYWPARARQEAHSLRQA